MNIFYSEKRILIKIELITPHEYSCDIRLFIVEQFSYTASTRTEEVDSTSHLHQNSIWTEVNLKVNISST